MEDRNVPSKNFHQGLKPVIVEEKDSDKTDEELDKVDGSTSKKLAEKSKKLSSSDVIKMIGMRMRSQLNLNQYGKCDKCNRPFKEESSDNSEVDNYVKRKKEKSAPAHEHHEECTEGKKFIDKIKKQRDQLKKEG